MYIPTVCCQVQFFSDSCTNSTSAKNNSYKAIKINALTVRDPSPHPFY